MSSNPYIIPNFHSLTETNPSLLNKCIHCYGFSSQLDFNGSGVYNQFVPKINKTANYYALRPTLPYFVDNASVGYNYAAKNCLIYCPNEELLVSDIRNQIIGLNIKENKVTDIGDNEPTERHCYSSDESTGCPPFAYRTQRVYNLFNCKQNAKPILELKLNSYENRTQITANSRNSIRFLKFNDQLNDENEVKLQLFNEINNTNISCPLSDPVFDNCDRNPLLENQILISFTSGNIIANYDIETNSTVWNSDNDSFPNESDKQIGLRWSQWHNRMFFYGEHERIRFVDTRGHRDVVDIYEKGGNNLFDWELFSAIFPNSLNDSQLYVASDYHLFLTDLRFPKENLMQLNHMLPKSLVRNIKSLVIQNSDDSNTEILVSSNFHRNCLMSFKNGPTIQPTSLHLPLHLSTPKDVDKVFENYFLRGLQLIPIANKTGFSIALLTNLGHIFMQDLYYDCDQTEDNCTQDQDRSFSAGVGSSKLVLDEEAIKYMTCINGFLDRMLYKREFEVLESNICLSCSLTVKCESHENVCHCKDSITFYEGSDLEYSNENSIESKNALIQVYDKHIGSDSIKLLNKLNDSEQMSQKTNYYTKKIYKLWENVFKTTSES